MWEHQPQVGTRARGCGPQAGPGETEAGPGISAPGSGVRWGREDAGAPGLAAQGREQALPLTWQLPPGVPQRSQAPASGGGSPTFHQSSPRVPAPKKPLREALTLRIIHRGWSCWGQKAVALVPGRVEGCSLPVSVPAPNSHGSCAGLRSGLGCRFLGPVVALSTGADGPQGPHYTQKVGFG